MTTFITRLDDGSATGGGADGQLRLAVKDAIDVAGVVTTVGCPAVADTATPAPGDAACLAGARSAQARLVGKTNLHELCFGLSGVNPWYGTPTNPLDPARIPGGSSSGSAVAVATGEADVALGTDTGGSVRVPAACCGVTGLKTTFGRVPVDGVWPLAPSLDTVGPIARDVAGVVAGMGLLEPGFAPASTPARIAGRIRVPGVDPVIEAAVDVALAAAGVDVTDLVLDGWDEAVAAFTSVLLAEAWLSDRHLVERRRDRLANGTASLLELGATITPTQLQEARSVRPRWQQELARAFSTVDVLALPTCAIFPPPIDAAEDIRTVRLTSPFNFAGVPALALPIPADHELPASLQLVGPLGGEELLVATGALVEAAQGP